MLNFKVGKVYKDNSGREWEFVSYAPDRFYPYFFKEKETNVVYGFCEQEGNIVIESLDTGGTKIPFVEEQEKERDWVVGEEYECYNTEKQKISKAELLELDESRKYPQYCFRIEGIERSFGYQKGEILCVGSNFVIFKNGIPEDLRKRINKNKQTDRIIRFQKGKKYKFEDGCELEFKRRIKTKKGMYVVFEGEYGDPYIFGLYMLNGIECKPAACGGMHLCADESIRNQDSKKAIRILK